MVLNTFDNYVKHDPTALELGYHEHYKLYVLSRHPVQSGVATRGACSTAFTRDRYRYHVYIGFGKRPMGGNPYVRFLVVKAQNLDDPRDTEGVVLIEDPMGCSTPETGRRPISLLAKYSKSPSLFALSVKCYKVAWAIIDMMNQLKIFDGKDFAPFQQCLELLSVPIIGQIMGAFVDNPKYGFDTVMADLVLPQAAHEENSILLSEYFKISEVLKAYPALWESKRLTDRSKGFICKIIADPLIGQTEGVGLRGNHEAKDFPLKPGEVKLLLFAMGVPNHQKWLLELGQSELLLLAQRAWGEISNRIGLENELSVMQMVDPGNEDFWAILRLPSIEVISDSIIRLFRACGLG